ncbi:DNA ligase 4 [Lutzomyia longipalpis]|uniref:DNA ligase 4 n=1 Tax=Lutzomyia longipalpis TaxID=7200 RepID=UPI00248381E9|nr:DNA ligase 4 [Lutzomyia longipalpis]
MSDSMEELCISKSIKFSSVTALLEKIRDKKSIVIKEKLIRKFLQEFQEFLGNPQNTEKKQKTSFYPVLRLLLPDCDHERGSYGIKEATLGRLYVRGLGIDGKSTEAKALLGGHSNARDYGELVFQVMQARSKQTSEISVFEVNKRLDLIAEHFQNGHSKKIDDVFVSFISEMTACDQKWLTRIILKHLALGIGKDKIFKILHPQALAKYNMTNKLSDACNMMECEEKDEIVPQSSGKDLSTMITLFSPIKPMLLARISLSALSETLKQKEYFIETKMDGERFHLHRSDGQYRYFSRNGHDYSEKFGRDFASGSLTPYIHGLFAKDIKIILDGEMMVWNRQDEFFYAKGDNYDVKNIHANDPLLKPVFTVYDILWLNGESLLDKPYAERRRLLRTLVREKPGALVLGTNEKIEDFDHLIKCFNDAVDRAEEGIVIKEVGSHYRPGVRAIQAGWFKLKPDYVEGAVTDLDLLIIGGYRDRKGYIESYLLGVYTNGPGERSDPIFHSVGKVSAKGLKFDERRKLHADLEAHWKSVEKEKNGRRGKVEAPQCLEWKNAVPDVWIEPSKSIVLEIKATELTKTDTYRTTHALKFPRIMAVRGDKPWYDSFTLAEFEQLCGKSGGRTGVEKLAKRHITRDDAKKKVPVKRQKITDLGNLRKLPEHIKQVSKIFENLSFCVLSTRKNMPSIDEIREMILKHSGQIVENPGPSTYAIIAGDITLSVRKYAEKKLYNIAKVDWLVRSLEGTGIPKKLPKFHPKDMISCTPELEDCFTKSFDEYGDSFKDPVTCESLKNLLDDMTIDRSERLLRRELINIEKEIYGDSGDGRNIFRPFAIHFFDTNQCHETKLAEIIFKSRQGNVIDDFISSNNSCIAINPLRLPQFRDQFANLISENHQLISTQWIHACHSQGKILQMTDYLI